MGVENLVPSNNMIYVPTLMPLCFASWMNMRPNTEAAADWITYSPFGTCRICIIEYTATIQQTFHLSESMTNDIIVQNSSHYVMVFMWSFLLLFEVPLQSTMDKSWVNLIWVGLYDYYVMECVGYRPLCPFFCPFGNSGSPTRHVISTSPGTMACTWHAPWHVPGMLHEKCNISQVCFNRKSRNSPEQAEQLCGKSRQDIC